MKSYKRAHFGWVATLVITLAFVTTASADLLVEMDNADSTAAVVGPWDKISTTKLLYYGDDYLVGTGVGGAQTKTVVFTSSVGYDNDGEHCFYAYWSDDPNRGSSVRYRIDYDGNGTWDLTINKDQRANGGQWNKLTCTTLGTPGQVPKVEVSNFGLTAAEWVVADGIRITREAVDGDEIVNNTVTDIDILDEPGVDYINTTGLGTTHDLTTSWSVINQISITAPSSGFVTCIGTGAADWDQATEDGDVLLGWHNAGGTTPPFSYNEVGVDPTGDIDTRLGITAIYTFSVSAGTTTFYLKASTTSAVANAFDFQFHGSSCMYFPTQY